MADTTRRLSIGEGPDARDIAIQHRPGAAPGLFWLGGFRSAMTGTKAAALDAYAAANGLGCCRFDYSGHGASGGRFEDGTVSRWLAEAEAVFETTVGPQILLGSSMGGWIALLLAEALRAGGKLPPRIAGMVLIAPAVDMTRALMWDRWSKKARATLTAEGIYHEPSDYSDTPYPITRALIEDGDRHIVGERLIEVGCPVHILQGMEDTDVPWRHVQALVGRLASDDVVLTLIKDGDHRLSRPEDLERLKAAIDGIRAEIQP